MTHPSTTITESVRDTTTEHAEPGTVTSTDQESTLKPRPLPHRCSTGVYKKVKMADELLSKIVGSNFTDMQSDGYMQEAQCVVYGKVSTYHLGDTPYTMWQVQDCVSQTACGTACDAESGYTFGKLYAQIPELVTFAYQGQLRYMEKKVSIAVGCGCVKRQTVLNI